MKSLVQIALSSALLITGAPLAGSLDLPGTTGWDAASAAPRAGVKPTAIKPKFNNAARPKPTIKPKFNRAARPKPTVKPTFNRAARGTVKPTFNGRAQQGYRPGTAGRVAKPGGAVVTFPKGPKVPPRVNPNRQVKPKPAPRPQTPKRTQPYGGKKPIKKPLRDTFNDKAKPQKPPKRKDQNTRRHDLPGPTFPNPGI